MAQLPELPQPGVEVIQEIRTVSPTIAAPTLAPCVMGVCKQIIEVLDEDGAVNADALVSGPAVATAPNVQASYSVNSDTLQVSVDGGPLQEFTFSGTDPLTAQQVASQINAEEPTGFSAYDYEDIAGHHLQLRTTSSGETKTITIVGGTALTALGWSSMVGYTYYGLGNYTNPFRPRAFPIPVASSTNSTSMRSRFVSSWTSAQRFVKSFTASRS